MDDGRIIKPLLDISKLNYIHDQIYLFLRPSSIYYDQIYVSCLYQPQAWL